MFTAWIKRATQGLYHPLNRVEISRSKIKSNYKLLSGINKGIKVCPVLKSNAYGHGLVETAKIVDDMGAPFICVDSLHEAYELLKARIKTKILVMGYVDPGNIRFKKLPFSFAAYDLNHFLSLANSQPQAGIHLFVDTGMSREGVPIDQFESFLAGIPGTHYMKIEGLMSHFAAADKPNDKRTVGQVANFKKALNLLKRKNITPKWAHIANSSGLLNSGKYRLGQFTNMARCGIAFYGIDPEGKNKGLKQASRLVTHIAQVKSVRKGSFIGYDFTYQARKDMVTAVLPIGYNDGVDRELSSKGNVYIKGKLCPIIGRVSMNLTVADVSLVKGIKAGDEAEVNFIVSSKTKIPYEFLVHLNPQTRRVVVD